MAIYHPFAPFRDDFAKMAASALIADIKVIDYSLPMASIRNAPIVVWLFLSTVIAAMIFGIMVEPEPDEFGFWFAGGGTIIATGVSLLRSKACWWIFAFFYLLAFYYAATRIYSEGILLKIDWEGWGKMVLQGLSLILLLSPSMVRWIAPLRRGVPKS